MIYIISKLSAKVRKIGQSTKHLPDFLPMLKSKRDKIIFLADTKIPHHEELVFLHILSQCP